MRTVKIREISAKAIQLAAEEKESLVITKDNVVCAVVIPVSARWVQQVIHDNLARIVQSVELGEKDIANGERFVTLENALAEITEVASAPPLRRVSIREMSGKLIAEAAEKGEPLAITSDNELQGVLLPVSERWLQRVVDANLSQVVRSIRLGEREVASGEPFTTLDDAVGTSPVARAAPATART